jgi:hypothetical protein
MENKKVKPTNFTLTIFETATKNSKVVERIETKSQRRFIRKLKLIPNEFNALLEFPIQQLYNSGSILQRKIYSLLIIHLLKTNMDFNTIIKSKNFE